MPHKFTTLKLKIPRSKDRRVKLTLTERDEIKKFYGRISQRKLAKMYNVSRRLIQFIGSPDKKVRDLQLRKERGNTYYNKEKNTKSIREHRKYKQGLYLNNELIKGDEKQ